MERNEWVVHFKTPVCVAKIYVQGSAWLGLETSACIGQLGPLEAHMGIEDQKLLC